jgi:hypothetical protein
MNPPMIIAPQAGQVAPLSDAPDSSEALAPPLYTLIAKQPFFKGLNSMPKLTGLELLKKMRAARMALPVIMATSALPTAEFARSPWLRPAATLVKPYTIAELLGKANEVLYAANGDDGQIAPPNPQGQPAVGMVPAAVDPDTCARLDS